MTNPADHREREATVLFGSAPSRLFEHAGDLIDAALREGVSSLPFFPSSSSPSSSGPAPGGDDAGDDDDGARPPPATAGGGDARLLSILRDAYGRNVDCARAHAERNVFAFPPSYARRKRARIAEAFLRGEGGDEGGGGGGSAVARGEGDELAKDDRPRGDGDGDGCGGAEDSGSTNDVASADASGGGDRRPPLLFPRTRDDVPPPERLDAVDSECADLRRRLRFARRTRRDLHARLEGAAQSRERVRAAGGAVEEGAARGGGEGGGAALYESVTAVVMGKEGLESLRNRATEVAKGLDEEKDRRSKEDEDRGAVDRSEVLPKAAPPPKPLTLEEDYEERRRRFGNVDAGGLAAVSHLVKKRRRQG